MLGGPGGQYPGGSTPRSRRGCVIGEHGTRRRRRAPFSFGGILGLMTLLDDARQELAQWSRQEIETATAYKWAARAVAAYEQLVQAPSGHTSAQRWLHDWWHYFDEAVEHAALADDTGDVLRAVRAWIQSQHAGRGSTP